MIFQEKCKIVHCREIARQIFLLRLTAPHISAESKPGQIVFIRTINREIPLLRRPFAVFEAVREEKTIDVLFEVVGKGTTILSRKESGQELDVLGPTGQGFPLPDQPQSTVIALAGGIGLGPIYFLCTYLAKSRHPVSLFYGAADVGKIARKSFSNGIHAFITTDDGSFGQKGMVATALAEHAASFPKDSQVFACGPEPMLKAVWEIAREKGWKCHVSLERHMACGVGACNGCVIDTRSADGKLLRKRVCKEGPVFNAQEIIWN